MTVVMTLVWAIMSAGLSKSRRLRRLAPLLGSVALLWALLPHAVWAQTADLTTTRRALAELGQGERSARGVYSSMSFYVPVPTGRVPVTGSALTLVYSHSPLLQPDRSTMTAVVNGVSVDSVRLTAATASRGTWVVPLPAASVETSTPLTATTALPAPVGYFIQLQFQLRVTDEVCEADSPAHWVTLHPESQVELVTRATQPELDQLAQLFVPLDGLTPLPTLALPTTLTDAELAAAGLAAYQIGRWAAAVGRDPLFTLQRGDLLPAADQPALVVASGTQLAASSAWGDLTWDGSTFVSGTVAAPPDHGILALAATDAPHLLVSGATPDAVRLAAQTLVDPARRALLTAPHAVVTAAPVTPTTAPLPWATGAASFAQLGWSEARRVTGLGEQVVDLYFQRPPEWDLREGSELSLAWVASPALRADTSWVEVSINGYVVGSRPLRTPDAPDGTVARFALPADLFSTRLDTTPVRDLNLRLRLMLDVPRGECDPVDENAAWVNILPTSAWQLRHAVADGLSLGRFPAPLVTDPTVATQPPLWVVLPAAPTDAEIASGLQVMAALGRWSNDPRPSWPQLVTADAVTEAMRQRDGLLLVGTPARNTVTAALATERPIVALAPDPAVYTLEDAPAVGYLHLVTSPWQRTGAVLALTGTDDAGVALAADALSRAAALGELRGQVAAITAPTRPAIVQDDRPAAAPESLTPTVVLPFVSRIPAWQIVGAVLLGAFVAVIAILASVYLRRRGSAG